jgi:CheY-like chemotaxis protein
MALSCADGLDALSLCGRAKEKPVAAVIDLSLPGLDGRSLVARLRMAKPFAALPVVMISGHDSVYEDAASVGAVAALKKPFDRRTVAAAVRRAVGR